MINKFFKSSQKYLSKLFAKSKNIDNQNAFIENNKNLKTNAKQTAIYAHLIENGSINITKAIDLYNADRLPAIIYNLKKIGKRTNSFEIVKERLSYINDLGKTKKCTNYIFKKL